MPSNTGAADLLGAWQAQPAATQLHKILQPALSTACPVSMEGKLRGSLIPRQTASRARLLLEAMGRGAGVLAEFSSPGKEQRDIWPGSLGESPLSMGERAVLLNDWHGIGM